MKVSLSQIPWRKCTAELLGTMILTFAVLSSLAQQQAVSIVASITLLLLVYVFGGISGAHVNPAVTAGVWILKKISSVNAVAYIVAQCIGAFAAQFLFRGVVGLLPEVTVAGGWLVAAGEAMGAFVFILGVSAVVMGQVHRAASGLTIGMALLIGSLLAALGSNGVLNPAVAMGIRSISIWYLLAPIVGGICAAKLYEWMVKDAR